MLFQLIDAQLSCKNIIYAFTKSHDGRVTRTTKTKILASPLQMNVCGKQQQTKTFSYTQTNKKHTRNAAIARIHMCTFPLTAAPNTWNTYAVQAHHLFLSFQLMALDWTTTYLAYLSVSYTIPISHTRANMLPFLTDNWIKIRGLGLRIMRFSI